MMGGSLGRASDQRKSFPYSEGFGMDPMLFPQTGEDANRETRTKKNWDKSGDTSN